MNEVYEPDIFIERVVVDAADLCERDCCCCCYFPHPLLTSLDSATGTGTEIAIASAPQQ